MILMILVVVEIVCLLITRAWGLAIFIGILAVAYGFWLRSRERGQRDLALMKKLPEKRKERRIS